MSSRRITRPGRRPPPGRPTHVRAVAERLRRSTSPLSARALASPLGRTSAGAWMIADPVPDAEAAARSRSRPPSARRIDDGNLHAVLDALGIAGGERRRVERTVLDIGERQQRRLGHALHDHLGQHLTGIACLGRVLEQKLAARGVDESAEADRLVRLVNEAIEKTRDLARRLAAPASDPRGLLASLGRLASDVEHLSGISCRVECRHAVEPTDPRAVACLVDVAREAVTNAIRHGGAGEVVLGLSSRGRLAWLVVADDGCGFRPEPARPSLGLTLMRCRARLAGGAVRVAPRRRGHGTMVVCRFPARADAVRKDGDS